MKKEFLEKALENDIRTDMLSYIDWHDLNQKNICDGVFGHEIAEMQGIVDRYNESIKNESAEFKAMYTKNVKCWIYDKQ